MKIVWLCHFANKEFNAFFKTPNVKEKAPWINKLIELFQDREDIDLHIVAPNIFNNKQQKVKIKNVNYYFFKYRPSFIPAILYPIFRIVTQTNFYLIKRKIADIINKINPDLIHLHGAENGYYSAGILPLFDRYPTLVTIQGFGRKSNAPKILINKSVKIEEKIIRKAIHFGFRTKEMCADILELNPNSILHFHNYPITIPDRIKNSRVKSMYDIVFFARINKDKGIEDLLEALAIVKKQKPDVKLHVIGRSRNYYLKFLINKTKQLNIDSNVEFLGFMKTQQEVYIHAIQAKICVLPTYHDIISGTIIESMLMKLPVIAYAVGSIPELNSKDQVVVLVRKHNIQELADNILWLLQSESKRNELSESAYIQATERFNNKNVVNDIIKAYNTILSA